MARGLFFAARKIVPYQNLQQEVKDLIAGFSQRTSELDAVFFNTNQLGIAGFESIK